MQAGIHARAGRFDTQVVEDEAVAGLHAEGAEGAIVVQHHQCPFGAVAGNGASLLELGVQLGGFLPGQGLLAKDFSKGDQVLLDHIDMPGLAVAVVHIEVQGRRHFAQLVIVAGLQRGDQNQVRPRGMHPLQVGLHDRADICRLPGLLVACKKVRHEVLGHARHGHAQLVEEVHFVHVQCHRALWQLTDQRGAQLMLHGYRRVVAMTRGVRRCRCGCRGLIAAVQGEGDA
ncbi:hypothetical protein D3C81_1190590 [compost metagenome]